MPLVSSWTPERTEILRTLWPTHSGGVIAEKLGITRCAVIGKARRDGLERKAKTPKRQIKLIKRKYVRHRFVGDGGWKISVAKAVIEIPKVNDAEIPIAQRKSVMELENHHCRWPVGEVGQPGFFFCGAPTACLITDRPYCPAHMSRAWTTRPRGARTNYSIKQMRP